MTAHQVSRIALTGVRILQVDTPGIAETEPTTVTVHDGRIVGVGDTPTDADRIVDGDGRYVLPGLVNAHDHLYSKEMRTPGNGMDIRALRQTIDGRDASTTLAVMLRNAWRSMRQGALIVRDLGARHGLNTRLASIIADGLVPGPLVLAAGRPIVMTGGHVSTFGREADGPDECRKAVREQRKAGAKVIKIMASGGVSNYPHEDYTVCEFTDAELSAITSEARKLGLPTCAHAFGRDAVDGAIRAGVDSIEHGVHLDPATIRTMVANRISYVPTMANMRRIASPEMNAAAGVPERTGVFMRDIVEPQRESVAAAIEAGVRIGLGTDSTGIYGEEITAAIDAGMSTEQVIRAATIDGAAICQVDAGVIAPGKLALMALYETDPRSDPSALVAPSAVFTSGDLFEQEELRKLTQPGS